MTPVIDLSAERSKRDVPDPEFVSSDAYEKPMHLFVLDYEYGGRKWQAELWAYDHDDAQARYEALCGGSARLGQALWAGVM